VRTFLRLIARQGLRVLIRREISDLPREKEELG
jgi:hypothetical protein